MSLSNREWKEYKFSDFVDISPTVSLKGGIDYSFIEMKDLQDGSKYCIPSAKRTLSGGARFAEGDTLFARITPCLENGKICKVKGLENGVGFGSTEFLIFRGKENISDNDFVFYLSRWDEVRGFAESNFEGTSGRQRVPKNCFDNLHLDLPSVTEQKSIATILSSLDDKIDLLHRQNKTLEQLAETLFRQWFVEEADESWETRKLFDIADVQNGYAFKSSDYVSFQEGFLEVLKMGHIERGGGLRSNPKRDFIPRNDKLKRWILNTNDIVMAMTDMKDNVVILGVPAMIDKDDNYVLNQRVARISLKRNSELINKYLLYVQLKDPEFIAVLQSKSNSGVQVNLSIEVIKDCDIIVPPIEVQTEKGTTITNLYLKKEKNQIQIRTLTQLRDTLLPKLMSGEVRVE
ncbi:MAG TPA: restriction endonuclease subunit S [Candidatus Woesebacteria bacterium]|nr:restriction endonuclease subunit S [Candidatus Woesebacteria bacterium]